MKTNKIRTKAIRGPGGIKCYCCNKRGSVKLARIMHNRSVRRKANAAIRNYKEED
jgi:hypothetical protein